jgi:ABC-type branched-subunit amino acid transport system permease subunit
MGSTLIFTAAGLGLDAAGLGGAGTMIATALGAADTFLLDRILRGWKPSQFVTGPLMKFVKSE